jgi:hypothetical protein
MEELESQERIGDFLVRIGALKPAQVAEILQIQEKNPGKLFGMIAIEKGWVDDKAIQAFLDKKK